MYLPKEILYSIKLTFVTTMKRFYFFCLLTFLCTSLFSSAKCQNLMESDYPEFFFKKPLLSFAVNKRNISELTIGNNSQEGTYYSVRESIHQTDFADTPFLQRNRQALNYKSLIAPSIGIAYGVIALYPNSIRQLNYSTRNEIMEDHPFFHTKADNYLQFSPAAAVIGLNIAGIHGQHSFKDELYVYAVSSIIMTGFVKSLKPIVHELRPDGSAYNSFPSGHTATAFAAAEWLRAEYSQTSPWIGVAGYAAASSVGVLRIYNNRHWVSDVVAGAAIGFLSTRIAYEVTPCIEKGIRHLFCRKKDEENHF